MIEINTLSYHNRPIAIENMNDMKPLMNFQNYKQNIRLFPKITKKLIKGNIFFENDTHQIGAIHVINTSSFELQKSMKMKYTLSP